MIYSSKEIRWFTNTQHNHLIAWFAARGQSFDNISDRTDYYLRMPGQTALGVKWREGRIEIKQRTGKPLQGRISDQAQGSFEYWVKWSFGLTGDEEVTNLISDNGTPSWLEVKKERLGLVLSTDNGKPVFLAMGDTVSEGCQLEYTRVTTGGQQWYTFGLEWFGEKQLPLSKQLADELVGPEEFFQADSMGYAEFLSACIL
jgi:hypothetical protein